MSHQDRRLPLPADYQYPTHGVDCDCPPCRNRFAAYEAAVDAEERTAAVCWSDYIDDKIAERIYRENYGATMRTQTAYGWGV